MEREEYKDICKRFIEHLEKKEISKKSLRDIQFCFDGVENVEFGGINKRHDGNKIIDVIPKTKA